MEKRPCVLFVHKHPRILIERCDVMKVEFENSVIVFNVEYGKVKNISISIDPVGHISVKAPKGTSEYIINEAVIAQGKAILKRLEDIQRIKDLQKPKKYIPDEKFLYLGKHYKLNELININESEVESLEGELKKFYISECKKIVIERVKIYEKELRVKPKSIKIVESQSQWGSCTRDKKIEFNYKLVMAPVHIIDYVVVHELCHILHMNHDRSFWRKVGSIIPDYQERQAYLARYGSFI